MSCLIFSCKKKLGGERLAVKRGKKGEEGERRGKKGKEGERRREKEAKEPFQ